MANWKEISLTARANVRLAATQLKEKNRRLAAANRLRTAIRCQEKAAEKEYLALGRYYYNVLRDPDNPVAWNRWCASSMRLRSSAGRTGLPLCLSPPR